MVDDKPWEINPAAADLANDLVESQLEYATLSRSVLLKRMEKTSATWPTTSPELMDTAEKVKEDAIATAMVRERELPDLEDVEIREVNEAHQKSFSKHTIEYLGNDVYKTRVQNIGALGGLETTRPFLFTRFDSVCIVEHILHKSFVYTAKKNVNPELAAHKEHAVIVGPPGASKSFTLLQVARRLFSLGKTVVWANRKKNRLHLFVRNPSEGKYHAWTRQGDLPSLPDSILDDANVYILVDPTDDGGSNKLALSYAFTIMAASANNDHYHNEYKNGLTFYYFAVWGLEELRRIAPYLADGSFGGKDGDNDLETRFNKVGGAPRYLISPEQYNSRLDLMEGKELTFSEQSLESYLDGSVLNYRSASGKKSISGLFFKADGIAPTYEKAKLDFISPHAASTFASKFRSRIMEGIQLRTADDSALHGIPFEHLSRKDLWRSGRFGVFKGCSSNVGSYDGAESALEWTNADLHMVKNKAEVKGWFAARPHPPNSTRELLCPPKNQACFDFADHRRRWFQVTLNPEHKISLPMFLELAEAAGVLKVKEGSLATSPQYEMVDSKKRIHLYLCVPEKEVKSFKHVQNFDIGDASEENHSVAKTAVQQHLLVIPTHAAPQPDNEASVEEGVAEADAGVGVEDLSVEQIRNIVQAQAVNLTTRKRKTLEDRWELINELLNRKALEPKDLEAFTVEELKDELREKRLKISGKKEDLMQRLFEQLTTR